MNIKSAQEIGKKARAFKHCVSIINAVDKNGETTVKLNCTGVEFKVKKGDGIYLRFMTKLAQYREELAAMEVTTRSSSIPTVAPAGAAPSEDDIEAIKRAELRAKRAAYQREWYAKNKAKKK